MNDWKWVGGNIQRLSPGGACASPNPCTSCSWSGAHKKCSTAVKVSTYLGHKTETSPLLFSIPHVRGLSEGCRYLLQPVARQSNLGLGCTDGVKLSSHPSIHVQVNRKIIAKQNKTPTTWLEGVCLDVWGEAEAKEGRWGLLCRDGVRQKASGRVYSNSLLESTMHAITEIRDGSERTHLANYLCLIYADLWSLQWFSLSLGKTDGGERKCPVAMVTEQGWGEMRLIIFSFLMLCIKWCR